MQFKKWIRRLVGLLLGVLTLLLLGVAAYFAIFPRFDPPDEGSYLVTPQRLERGRYLVENVAGCLDCHSKRNWDYYSGPLEAGSRGGGAPVDYLGSAKYSANITPGGLKDWTDGEIARAISAGVDRKGQALYPLMPYDTYAALPREDLESIVIYLRTLEEIPGNAREGGERFALEVIGRLLPSPYEEPLSIDRTDTIAYGRLLSSVAECDFCHGSDLSGGMTFRIPGGEEVKSANISRSTDGIGSMSRDQFVGRFKSFADPEAIATPGALKQGNTVMPWSRFGNMTESDLGAIYDFIYSLPPIDSAPESPE